MKKVYFQNDGEIDPISMTTFGVNVKENDNPFGFFGTGLKYSISVLLRNKIKFKIFSGKREYVFGVMKQEIRGKEFEVVTLDGHPLGFTTELGKTWELWQIFRELYCNTLDEFGEVSDEEAVPTSGKTTIIVAGAKFYDEYKNRQKTVLQGTPRWSNHRADVHILPGYASSGYMNSIRVIDLPKPSKFAYNLKKTLTLTEDRTLKYANDMSTEVRDLVLTSNDEDFIEEFMIAENGTFESSVEFQGSYLAPSNAFCKVMQNLKFGLINNQDAIIYWKKRQNQTKEPEVIPATEIQQKQINRAVDFVLKMGYDLNKYPIVISDDLGIGVLGRAYLGKIFISPRVFHQGTKQVVATCLEEFLHLEYHYRDETYEFQTFLFDLAISQAEIAQGDPV